MTDNRTTELREKAKLLRTHADGLNAPYIVPSTKELMALTMLDSASRMEQAAYTIESLRDRLQAATLGSWTCRIEERNGDWYCDACGEMVGTRDPASELSIDGNAVELWNYCPNCGARVEVNVCDHS